MKKINLYLSSICLTLIGVLSLAQSANAIEWYFGAGAGYSDFEVSGPLDTNIVDDNDTAFAIHWGMPIEDYFTFDFSYNDYGKVEHSTGLTDFEQNPKSIAASAAFHLPIHEQLKVYARLGVEAWEVSFSGDSPFIAGYDDATGVSPLFGLGLNYWVNRDIQLFAEVQQHDFDHDDVELKFTNYHVGFKYFY